MNNNMQRERVVYALHDGFHNYGYVGTTTVNMKTRWWEHRSRARSGHAAPVYDWIRKIGIDNLQIEKLQDVPAGVDPHLIEVKHIKQLLDDGHPIQNQIGRDGVPHSNADRMKKILSEKKAGKETWIKGKRGLEAGWTDQRKKQQAERFSMLRKQGLVR